MKSDKFSEEEMAAAAEVFFQSKGWELYPETVLPNFGGRPDFIGVKGGLCMACECKKTFSYPVLEQLTRWKDELVSATQCKWQDESLKGMPNLLYAVVGAGSINDLKRWIATEHRIGVIMVTLDRGVGAYRWQERQQNIFDDHGSGWINDDRWRFEEVITPRLQIGSRQTAHRIIEQLNPDMKCATAGASGAKGGYMTPFKRTLNKATKVLEQGGEWHISHIVNEINSTMGGHHYSNDTSAKAGISKFLVDFGIAERVDDFRPVFKMKTELTNAGQLANPK